MAQYKVIQDIEAEDKLLGPLSLRQFIYAGIAATLGYLSFISVSKGAPYLLLIFLPPMLFCMFFAWPWSPDQPTEVWALARIRFFFIPRRRIWDQSGMKDLVTITAPKQVQKVFTNGLSQTEVRSRLSALADTIDSRGWTIKNSNVSMPTLPSYGQEVSDRLVPTGTIPQPVSDIDIHADDDILDAQNNPIAHQFDEMIQASSAARRQKIVEQMQAPDQPQVTATTPKQAAQPPANYWFLNQQNQAAAKPTDPNSVVFANPTLVQPGAEQQIGPVAATPTPGEEALGEQLLEQHQAAQHSQNMHLKTIHPVGVNPDISQTATAATPPVTAQTDAAILNLANNNDLDVATLARQAKKARNPEPPEDEVVISLR
jgi:hypothetical protein